MRVCIHRGTKEIGGTCVEIESQGQRIVLDVGLPLDAADPDALPLHPIKGFKAADKSLLGVVISHPHQDHYGLAHRLPEETAFLIGKAAESILAAAALFSRAGLKLQNVRHLADRIPIKLGSFTITPYLVDHSTGKQFGFFFQRVKGAGSLRTRRLRFPSDTVSSAFTRRHLPRKLAIPSCCFVRLWFVIWRRPIV
jgi:ribonuclease J